LPNLYQFNINKRRTDFLVHTYSEEEESNNISISNLLQKKTESLKKINKLLSLPHSISVQ